ncbi:uncharacterized protein LTR77_005511 [Saxophila tyrrhenica]|uniref:Uncharacterized protein n=1 Tax=Saxophila tyrrhenica TaxID=1690608 RepID=A0AAV9PCT9_9PEZI|nr:hypothetical protein LTR77_005511 [Saxophila tyrrhenica]
MHAPTAASHESRDSSTSRRSSPSPPPSPPPERPFAGLTPTNTFASQRNDSIVAENNALAEELALQLSFVEEMADASRSSDEILDHVEVPGAESEHEDESQTSEHMYSDLAPEMTQSEPDMDRTAGAGRIFARPVPDRPPRSTSMPSRPLRSALVVLPPPTEAMSANGSSKKKTHFDDGGTTTDSAPPHHSLLRSGLTRDLVDQARSGSQSADSRDLIPTSAFGPAELAAALGVFEEAAEELWEVAEEHAEAHGQLSDVARDLAGFVLERRSGSHGSVRTISDLDEDVEAFLPRRGSAADLDVDESCMDDSSKSISMCDTEEQDEENDAEEAQPLARPKPEVVFMTSEGNIRKLDLDTIPEERNSSTETVWAPSSRMSRRGLRRHNSEPEGSAGPDAALNLIPRRASMSDAGKIPARLRMLQVPGKTTPAACAVTACSVKASEPVSMVATLEHHETGPSRSTRTAQTEDPATPSPGGMKTLPYRPLNPGLSTPEDDNSFPGPPSPMQKVKTKLAVWSWAREQGLDAEDGQPKWMELLDPHEEAIYHASTDHSPHADERPLTPPNSHRTSVAFLSPNNAGTPKHSTSPSPANHSKNASEIIEEDDEEPPLELKSKSTNSRPCSIEQAPTHDYLTIPVSRSQSAPTSPSEPPGAALPRQLSNLAAEETHFTTHRNSVDLLQYRKQHEAKVNHNLMNARDSMILTKSKFEESYPRALLDVRPAWSRELSSITDASPPDARRAAGVRAMARSVLGAGQMQQQRSRRAGFEVDEAEHVK